MFDMYFKLQRISNNAFKEDIKKYLKNGTYFIDKSGTYMYLEEAKEKTIDNFSDTFEASRKAQFGDRLAFMKVKDGIEIKSDNKQFKGDCLLISSSNDEKKFFNFNDNIVLTKFNNRGKFETRVRNMQYFSKFFNVPELVEYKFEDMTIQEKCIKKNKNFNAEEVLIELLKQYKNYFIAIAENRDYEIETKVDYKKYVFDSTFSQNIYEAINNNIASARLKMHGDLWRSNIILDNDKMYMIDFEKSDTFSMTYDFFTFIFNEYVIKNDSQLLDNFFSGNFDEILTELFKTFNLKYESKFKKDYFLQYVLVFYFDRCKNTSIKFRIKKRHMIMKIFKRYDIELK
ncbi:MAG: phosphotransferase [Clostridia bacterium]|nr:phosphotransferase [Clostridia bacterium]